MEVFRNMWRKKMRSLLTVLGIAIGILAFTVMGSMALRFNKMIQGGKKYITGQITLAPKGSNYMGGGAMLPVDTLTKISQVEGVNAVAAGVSLMLDEPDPDKPLGESMSFGSPPTIEASDLNSDFENRNWQVMAMKEGEMLGKGGKDDEVTIGYTIALDRKLKTGDTMKIRGRDFKVIGVIDKTMTGPDTYVFMSIVPAREMLIESNPFLKSLKEQSDEAAKISDAALAKLPAETRDQLLQAKMFKIEDISTGASVSWKDGYDPNTVAQKIKDQFKNEVQVLAPKEMGDLIDKASAVFNSVILGSAILALVVGVFSIVNTMVMSISERTKEIGIKKAIGASAFDIAKEYTLEAGIIGLLGGAIGLGLGCLMMFLLNNAMKAKGAEIFVYDPTFLISVIVFSFVLGTIAGVFPALRAAKLQVVKAIREL